MDNLLQVLRRDAIFGALVFETAKDIFKLDIQGAKHVEMERKESSLVLRVPKYDSVLEITKSVVEPIFHDALENQAVDETHPTWIEFDAEALRHNLSIVRKSLTPGTQIIASVKANAYGHGIIPVSQVLEREGVEMLATGSFSDAQEIRRVGVKTPILMLAGTLPGGMKNLIQEGFIPTVYDLIGARSAAAAAKAIKDDYQHPIFIKVDCGMGRLGISLPDTLRF